MTETNEINNTIYDAVSNALENKNNQCITLLPSTTGKSAYDIAVDYGYIGTESMWLVTLQGLSAYEVAVSIGFKGTKTEWLKYIKGKSTYELSVDNGFIGSEREWLSGIVNDTELMSNLNKDLLSIDKAANGDINTTVVTRTGETYPSAKKAISEGIVTLFENGGLPATPFTTKALMTASVLVDGKYAQVTDDAANNGLYVKTAGAWVKSNYDPLKQATELSNSKAIINPSTNLLEFVDANGALVASMTGDGNLFLPNLTHPVQPSINELTTLAKYDTNDGDLLTYKDANDKFVFSITNTGSLVINDVMTSSGSINSKLAKIDAIPDAGTGVSDVLKNADKLIAHRDLNAMNKQTNITTAALSGVSQTFQPALIRIEKNKFLLTIANGGTGDFASNTSVVGYWLTVSDDYLVTRSAPLAILSSGTDAIGAYSAMSGVPLYVNKGIHAGRIYIYFIKRYGTAKDTMCYIYSDDMCVSWSPIVDMTPFIPDMAEWRIATPSPAKMIQIQSGTYEGRIILPCWRGDTNYPSSFTGLRAFIMYSDDGGETYSIGAETKNPSTSESAIAEISDNRLVFMTRSEISNLKGIEVSEDGGVTLGELKTDSGIITHKVQSGFVQASNRFDSSVSKLIVSTPLKAIGYGSRENLALYISYDNKKFDLVKQIQTGQASYSEVDVIDESHLLVVYAGSNNMSIEAIVVNLKSIISGE